MSQESVSKGGVYTGTLQQLVDETGCEEIVPAIIAMRALKVNKLILSDPDFNYEDVNLKITYINDESFELELLEGSVDGEV